jgi:hypothetical protein
VKFSPLGNKRKSSATKDFCEKTAKLPDFKDLFYLFIYLFIYLLK